MRTAKLCATVCTLSFAVMVLGAHESGQLFPWVHGFVFVSATTLLVGVFFGRLSTISTTAIAIGFGVALRIFIFEWPASMIGIDPDKYAVGVIRIIQTGALTELKREIPVYGALSAFHLLNSLVAIVSGFGGKNVLVAIPILIGILFPLTAVALTTHHTRSSIATGVSAIIAAIAAIGVLFGYWPVVQTIAVLLWCPSVIGFSRLFSGGDTRDFVAVSITVIAATFAHKLSMFVLAGAVGAALFVRYIQIDRLTSKQSVTDGGRIRTGRPWTIWLLLAIGLAIQWTILTVFARPAILSIAIPLLTGGVLIVPSSEVVLAAVPGNPGIVGIVQRRGDFLVLLATTAIASLGLWVRNRTWSMCILLGATLMTAVIVGISIVGVGVASPQRAVLFGIPVFAAVLGIAIKQIAIPQSTSRILAAFVVILIVIASQAGSAALAPDYPDEPQQYLTSGEVSAKTFVMDHTQEPVAMQFFYAREQADLDAPNATQKPGLASVPGVVPLNDQLLNATLLNNSHEMVLLREHQGTMRFGNGQYRLTWNPIRRLSTNSSYNRVFDNDQAVGFANID